MKSLLLSVSVVVSLVAGCSEEPAGERAGAGSLKELTAVVRTAVEAKDIDMLIGLGHWENVPNNVRDGFRRHLPATFEYVNPTLTFREMTEKERQPVEARDTRYAWNMAPVGFLEVAGDDKDLGSTSIPIGKTNGRVPVATRCPVAKPE